MEHDHAMVEMGLVDFTPAAVAVSQTNEAQDVPFMEAAVVVEFLFHRDAQFMVVTVVAALLLVMLPVEEVVQMVLVAMVPVGLLDGL
jgi:hypothetical protein